jgi:hypothetical protein
MMAWWLRNRGDLDDFVDKDVARSCSSKDAYPNEASARAQIAMQGMAGSLFTYECRYCASWHLTRRKPLPPKAPTPGREDDEDEDED